eukprot:gene39762-48411_t
MSFNVKRKTLSRYGSKTSEHGEQPQDAKYKEDSSDEEYGEVDKTFNLNSVQYPTGPSPERVKHAHTSAQPQQQYHHPAPQNYPYPQQGAPYPHHMQQQQAHMHAQHAAPQRAPSPSLGRHYQPSPAVPLQRAPSPSLQHQRAPSPSLPYQQQQRAPSPSLQQFRAPSPQHHMAYPAYTDAYGRPVSRQAASTPPPPPNNTIDEAQVTPLIARGYTREQAEEIVRRGLRSKQNSFGPSQPPSYNTQHAANQLRAPSPQHQAPLRSASPSHLAHQQAYAPQSNPYRAPSPSAGPYRHPSPQ